MAEEFNLKTFLEFVDAHHPMINGVTRDGQFVLLRAIGTPDQFRLPIDEWKYAVENDLVAQLGGPGVNHWEVGDTGHTMLQELRAPAQTEGGAA